MNPKDMIEAVAAGYLHPQLGERAVDMAKEIARLVDQELGFEKEEHWGPQSFPTLDDEGNPVMDDRLVVPGPKYHFMWGTRERWVTKWESTGDWLTSEQFSEKL